MPIRVSGDADGAELDADSRADGLRGLRDGVFPGALARAAHDDEVAVAEWEAQALAAFGPDTVYYATQLRGAANGKAKRELHFRPRRLEWLGGSD